MLAKPSVPGESRKWLRGEPIIKSCIVPKKRSSQKKKIRFKRNIFEIVQILPPF